MAPVLITVQVTPSTKEIPVHGVVVEGSAGKPGQTGHYRNSCWSDLQGAFGRLTVPDLFESGLAQSKDLPFLGHREQISADPPKWADHYTWQTWAEVDVRRKAVGSALHSMFESGRLTAGTDFRGVGIWSVNRPEWQIVDSACHAYNMASVALYDTLGANSVEYVINHSELPVVFSSSNHIQQLLDCANNCPTLKVIVSFDPLDATAKAKFADLGKERGIAVIELKEVEDEGKKSPLEPIKATLDQIATICYTSGTTSTPKGALITHKNLASAALGYIHGLLWLPPNGIMISYLPLAHCYERVLELVLMSLGGRLGFFTGNPLNLVSDIQVLKPDVFPAVPRVLNKVYQLVMANTRAPGLKGLLFRKAVETKLANLHANGATTHMLWDKLVFKKVQAALGGNLKLICSGSAPISADTMDFFKIAFGCEVVEGYGLTESCAVGMKSRADDMGASGTIGGPTMINEVKLVDVPALSYHSTDKPNARGEICLRGDNIFSKYYKDDKNTAEAIDADGWFHTGDIAEVDSAGRFRIIDRVKNIMKLSQGEYVALEKVENLYSTCPIIAQIYVHGESIEDHLVAVVVPDPVALSPLASKAGHPFDPASVPAFNAAVQEPAVVKIVLDSITAHVKGSGNVKGFEVVKAIHLTTEQFTVDNDTLTPTFKIKRRNAYDMHKQIIQELYRKKA